MTLFEASTGQWTDTMYTNALGCDNFAGYPYDSSPELCTHPQANFLAYVFFPAFVLVGNIVLLTLFIGIVVAEMDSMALQNEIYQRNMQLVEKFKEKYDIPDKQAKAYIKLFDLIQGFKSGHTADIDFAEMKGILHLMELVHRGDAVDGAVDETCAEGDKIKLSEEQDMSGTPSGQKSKFRARGARQDGSGDGEEALTPKTNDELSLDEGNLIKAFATFDDDKSGKLDLFEFFCLMHSMQVHREEDDVHGDPTVHNIQNGIQFVDFGVRQVMREMNHVQEPLHETLAAATETVQESVEAVMDTVSGTAQLMGNAVGGVLGDAANKLGAATGSGAVGANISNGASATVGTLTGGATEGMNWFLKQYVQLGVVLMQITTSEPYSILMLAITVAAGALVGVQIGYGLEEDPILAILDWLVLLSFASECVMKILSDPLAPWRYFTNENRAWNMFDFTIVVVSMPGVLGSQAVLLRLFRLARIGKIIKKVPTLNILIVSLLDGISACGYIMMLMGIIFYIYACIAVILLKQNDPWHFQRINLAFESLFRTATLDGWEELWLTSFYGCKAFDLGFYVAIPPAMLAIEGGQRAAGSRYCEANGISGHGVCDPQSAQCVLLGDSGSIRYGCECLGSMVIDVTAGHIFATGDAEPEHSAVVSATNAAPAHSGHFPYLASNNFSVSEMPFVNTSMFCAQADVRYPHMPALDHRGGHMTYCEDIPSPLTAVWYYLSFIVISAFILISLFVGTVLISVMSKTVQSINLTKSLETKEKYSDNVEMAFMDKYSKSQTLRKQAITRFIFEAWTHRREITASGRRLKAFGLAQLKMIQQKAVECRVADAENPKTEAERREEKLMWKQVSDECTMDDVVKKVGPFFVDPYRDLNKDEVGYYRFSKRCDGLAHDPIFKGFITFCIVVASVMVGFQVSFESTGLAIPFGLFVTDTIISAIFLFELVVKIIAEGFTPWCFFFGNAESKWNRLDFVIVVASYTPLGSIALLLRMVRLFRVLKLLKVVPQLRMLITALMGAVESIVYTMILMFMFFFVCAILCVMIFQENDPSHFANLHVAIMTLFQSATGDGWSDIMYTSQYGCDAYPTDGPEPCDHPHAFGWLAVLFFVSFYIMGGGVFLNLFIGVVTAGMKSAMGEVREDEIADERVRLLQEMPNGNDLSVFVCESLSAAFDALDVHSTGRLYATDVQFAFYLVNLFPSKQQVNQLLMETCEALAVLQDREFDAENENTSLDRGEWIHMLTSNVIIELPQSPDSEARSLPIATLRAQSMHKDAEFNDLAAEKSATAEKPAAVETSGDGPVALGIQKIMV
jgi:voltage-gated sodium channel